MKGYQPRKNLVKDESGDLRAGFHKILHTWKNYVSQLSVMTGRYVEIHTVESFISDPSPFEVEMAIAKL
jgi:hypothetical protein